MRLSFGGFQIAILVLFVVVSLVLFAIFFAVARQARRNVEYETVAGTGYRLRTYWFVFLVVLLGSAVVLSLVFLPAQGAEGAQTEVSVTGYQFNWTVQPAEVPSGTTVAFRVTSSDVNHGIGLYDPDGTLMGVVQAMPGYENTMRVTLKKPGDYVIACLEFCGVGHHRMVRNFKVTP